MKNYIIAYDLDTTGKEEPEYPELIKMLKEDFKAIQIEKSVWVVKSSSESKNIGDKLIELLHDKDRIIVCEILDENGSHYNLMNKI